MEFYNPDDIVMGAAGEDDNSTLSGGTGSGIIASMAPNLSLGLGTNSSIASIKVEDQYFDDFDTFEPMMRGRANTWHGRAQNVMLRESSGIASVASSTPPPQGSATPSSAGSGGSGLDREGMFSPRLGEEDSPGGAESGGALRKPATRRNAWGNQSYADLITRAIENSPEQRLTLSQIYAWMVQNVPFFTDKGDSNSSAGWKRARHVFDRAAYMGQSDCQTVNPFNPTMASSIKTQFVNLLNSIRHNLSLHNRFKRVQNEGAGKSSWWMINPDAKPSRAPRRRAATMDNNTQAFDRRRLGGVAKRVAAAVAARGMASVASPASSTGSQGSLLSPDNRGGNGGGFLRSSLNNDLDLFPSLSPQDFRPRASSNASSIGVGASGRLSPIQALPEPIDDSWNPSRQQFSGGVMGGFSGGNGSSFQPMGDTLAETLRDSLSGIFSSDNPYGMDDDPAVYHQGTGAGLPYGSANQMPAMGLQSTNRLAADPMTSTRHRCLSGGSVTVGGNFSGMPPSYAAQNLSVLSAGGMGMEAPSGLQAGLPGERMDAMQQQQHNQNLLKLLQQQQVDNRQHQLQLQQQQKQNADLSKFLDRRMLVKLLAEKPHLKEKIQQMLLEKQQKGLQQQRQQERQGGVISADGVFNQRQSVGGGDAQDFHGGMKNGTTGISTSVGSTPVSSAEGSLERSTDLEMSVILPSDLDFDFRPSIDIDCDIEQILRYDSLCFGGEAGTDFEGLLGDISVDKGGNNVTDTAKQFDDFSDIIT